MKPVHLFLIYFTSACLLSCGDSVPSPAGDEGETPPGTEETAEATDADFVGLSQAEGEALAKERGFAYRVTSVDGESRAVTMDYNPERINFEIEADKIVKTSRG